MEQNNMEQNNVVRPQKDKIVAGILAILLGALGVHKFYLGKTGMGVVYLLVTLLTLGIGGMIISIISIVEGILYLTATDEDFQAKYVN